MALNAISFLVDAVPVYTVEFTKHWHWGCDITER